MALSRPLYSLLGGYLEELFNHPVRTKSLTSCVLATSANYVSQKIAGAKKINQDSLLAYGLFGFFFGGTVPHYFYAIVEKVLRRDMRLRKMFFFLIERLTYAPLYLGLSLYALPRFEGYEHEYALSNLKSLYWPILNANWTYLSIPVFINIYFVPPMLRVLIANIIGFIWIIFIANKRRKAAQEARRSIKPTVSKE